jgi:hypothetical protein
MLSVIYCDCPNKAHYTECLQAKCCYTECFGTEYQNVTLSTTLWWVSHMVSVQIKLIILSVFSLNIEVLNNKNVTLSTILCWVSYMVIVPIKLIILSVFSLNIEALNNKNLTLCTILCWLSFMLIVPIKLTILSVFRLKVVIWMFWRWITKMWHSVLHYAECCKWWVFPIKLTMPSVVMLSVVVLNVAAPI